MNRRRRLMPVVLGAAMLVAGCTAGPLDGTDIPPSPKVAQGELPMMKSAEIWNRAVDYDYDGPRAEGDRALHDLLMLDNVAQNGGLLHGLGVLDQDELTAAVAGYRWFGLDTLADGIESVAAEAAGIDTSDPSSLPAEEALEVRADDLYFGEQGSDLIDPAFEQKLADNPDAFAGSTRN